MAVCMLLGGAACAACAFVPAGGAQIGLASIGKFGIAAAFAIASIYTSGELPLHQPLRPGAPPPRCLLACGAGSNSAPGLKAWRAPQKLSALMKPRAEPPHSCIQAESVCKCPH